MPVPSMVDSAIALLAELALTATGTALGGFAVRSFCQCRSRYCVFKKLEEAKTVPVSGLCSVLSTECYDEKLIVLRGFVQESLGHNVLVHQGSGKDCVVLQETRGNIICGSEQELKEAYALRKFLPFALPKSCEYQTTTSIKTLPFVLTGSSDGVDSGYVSVNLDGSTYPLPLTRAFHQLEEIHASEGGHASYTVLEDYFKPVGLIEEMILPVGKEITAVGFCSLRDGNPQIMACKDFPYFLSDKSQDEMLSDLDDTWRSWWFYTIVFGSLSLGILGYVFRRHWKRWRQHSKEDDVADVDEGNEESSYQNDQSVNEYLATRLDES